MGFKAEHNLSKDELTKRAFDILQKADADLVVANDVAKKGMGFDVDTNEVYVVDKGMKVQHIPLADKGVIADSLLNIVKNKNNRC